MKKYTIIVFLLLSILKCQAQDYKLSFTGSGAATSVASVQVENVTTCTSLTLNAGDILHLTGPVGIAELNTARDRKLVVFPNPMNGSCSVDFEATADSKTTIVLYDMFGERILKTLEFLAKGHQTFSLSGVNSGIYILKVESDKYSYVTKIVCNSSSAGNAAINHRGTTSLTGSENQENLADTDKTRNLKSGESMIDMPYTAGEVLKLTGQSGNFKTVYMLVPTQTQTVAFEFVACKDADNNNYAVVQIGKQIWMAENLKTTKYRNGDPITNVADNVAWSNLSTEAYCDYNNDSDLGSIYGKLYNWYSVSNTLNFCPEGWHVPTSAEWKTLTDTLSGESIAGDKLKETCAEYWISNVQGSANETGFTGLPGGTRGFDGIFNYVSFLGSWWTSSESPPYYAATRSMYYGNTKVDNYYSSKKCGFSIRCVKD